MVLTKGLFSNEEASNLKLDFTLLDKAVNFTFTFSFEVISPIKIDLISLRLLDVISPLNLYSLYLLYKAIKTSFIPNFL